MRFPAEVGRCRREEHGRFQAYRDDLVVGLCVLGFFVERLRGDTPWWRRHRAIRLRWRP